MDQTILHSLENMERCWELVESGVKQNEIAKRLKLSRSTTSRLCRAAAKNLGNVDARRFLREMGAYETLTQFIFARIEFLSQNECWEWKAGIKPGGYGTVNFNGKGYQAHRASYECFVGPIKDGKELDHLCGNRSCVNPFHLKISGRAENLLRRPSRMDTKNGS